MRDLHSVLVLLGYALLLPGLGCGAYLAARVKPLPRPGTGHRGLARALALNNHALLRLLEPVMRWFARVLSWLPIPGVRAWLGQRLVQAGQPMGLCPDELMAGCVLGAIVLAPALGCAAATLQHGWYGALFGALLGGAFPAARSIGMIGARVREVSHALPPAVDLLALCMGAGLDFTSSLRLLVEESSANDALRQELEHVLRALQLGQTRRQALLDLATRVPSEAVHDFVSAVVQADEKGSPLSAVLEIQARTLRLRRSVLAEEAATRAGVLLLLPLLLLLTCILTIMFGPFMINGIGVG